MFSKSGHVWGHSSKYGDGQGCKAKSTLDKVIDLMRKREIFCSCLLLTTGGIKGFKITYCKSQSLLCAVAILVSQTQLKSKLCQPKCSCRAHLRTSINKLTLMQNTKVSLLTLKHLACNVCYASISGALSLHACITEANENCVISCYSPVSSNLSGGQIQLLVGGTRLKLIHSIRTTHVCTVLNSIPLLTSRIFYSDFMC